jgi:acyl carrier protein
MIHLDRWQTLFLTIACAVVVFPYKTATANSASTVPTRAEIAQINICGAGRWFTIVKNGRCEIHAGVTVNPSWIGYMSADDYLRWRSHKVTADSLSKTGRLISMGDDKFASELTRRVEDSSSADPSIALCFPQLPEHSGQAASQAIQVPGCNGARLGIEPWSQSSQCSPLSGIRTIVRLLVAHQLEVPIQRVELQSEFIKDLGADDLDTEELVMWVEETFEFEVPDKDAERIVTVQDLVSYVVSKICH